MSLREIDIIHPWLSHHRVGGNTEKTCSRGIDIHPWLSFRREESAVRTHWKMAWFDAAVTNVSFLQGQIDLALRKDCFTMLFTVVNGGTRGNSWG